jgi:hypothetical protein
VRCEDEPERELIRADFPRLAHRHCGAAIEGSFYSAESARSTEITALNNRLSPFGRGAYCSTQVLIFARRHR